MKTIPENDREKLVSFIRENIDTFDSKQWCLFSAKIDWTIDELREFQNYIDWHTYYVYCCSKRLTVSQLLEFKEKHSDWCMIFQYRLVSEELLRRWVNTIGFDKYEWEYVFKKQHVSKQFRHRYRHLLQD